jgi:chromosomal replication initiation ATPase DnaA
MTYTLSDDDVRRCREINLSDRRKILDIANAVAEMTEIPITHILSARRSPPISKARWLISYIAHVQEGHPVEAIGRALRIHHTSVCYGVKMERKRREGETPAG